MATDSIQILGESIGYWLQTVAIVSSACAAVVVIWHNGKTARLRATIDMLISEQRDDEYNEKYASLSKLINTDKSLVDYARFLDTEHQEFDNIRFVLNRLEFIAQGIRVGAFEEKIYKDLNCTNYLKIWQAVEPLVAEIRRRKNRDTYYQEIEWLAKRWKLNPIRKI